MSASSVWKSLSRHRLHALAAVSSVALVVTIALALVLSRGHPSSVDNLVSTGNPASAGSSANASEVTVACEDLPNLWSGSGDIAYDAQTHIVQFGWGDGTSAKVRDTEPGCAAQPGLEEQLRGAREGAIATERAECRELQYLVDAVRAERSSNGLSTSGGVTVSDAAQAAAARRNGSSFDAAVAKRRAGSRTIDLDQSDQVLEQCPR
jgi:hypothetical protein